MRCFTRNTITDRVFTSNEDRRGVSVPDGTRIHVLLGKLSKHLDAVGAAMAADVAAVWQQAAAAGWVARPRVEATPILIPAFAMQSMAICYRPMSRSWQESQMLSGSGRQGVLQRS